MLETLKIFCDGGARGNPGPAASAFVVFNSQGKKIAGGSKYLGESTNNVAEYTAVVMALEWLSINAKSKTTTTFVLDSDLVTKQINGIYKIKSERLKPLVVKVKNLQRKINGQINFTWSPRSKNKLADKMVNEKLDEKM